MSRANDPLLSLDSFVDLKRHPLDDTAYRMRCRRMLDDAGLLVLPGFLTVLATEAVRREGMEKRRLAFYCTQKHSVYLSPKDPVYGDGHPRNRQVNSSKGCITDDQISAGSPLRAIYDSDGFRSFLCTVLNEEALYPYADPLSSINIHYADENQELGWHFDNSSFAITLMIQPPDSGGKFEYIRGMRNSGIGDMNFDGVGKVLDGKIVPEALEMRAGTLVLFRGRDAIHRVTPVNGRRTRMLVVLAYNTEPNVSLSESARMTFYGRLV